MTTLTRRSMLRFGIGAGAATAMVCVRSGQPPAGSGLLLSAAGAANRGEAVGSAADPTMVGKHLEIVPFVDRRRDHRPRECVYGEGLEGRYRLDLSTLGADSLIVPRERFYIRTRAPGSVDPGRSWSILVDGLLEKPFSLTADELDAQASDQGVHLMECSGNGLGGLISAAQWCGVPLARVLDRAGTIPDQRQVLVNGVDDHEGVPEDDWRLGASWVFTVQQLRAAGAFLATRMNGKPLRIDHGAPVRLIVPGWYGCTCIKWVNEIRFVDRTEPATAQMREFASRTHQRGVPARAADFVPAVIDLAAMPIRAERRRLPDGDIVYRLVGIIWGGNRLIDTLMIGFSPFSTGGRQTSAREEIAVDLRPVENFAHTTNRTWQLWSHLWRPPRPGRYAIELSFDDPRVVARKMRQGIYRRSLVVT